jgi:hypothetical protein
MFNIFTSPSTPIRHAILDQTASILWKRWMYSENKVGLTLLTVVSGTFVLIGLNGLTQVLKSLQPKLDEGDGWYSLGSLIIAVRLIIPLLPFVLLSALLFPTIRRWVLRTTTKWVLDWTKMTPTELMLECGARHPECLRVVRRLYYGGMRDATVFKLLRESCSELVRQMNGGDTSTGSMSGPLSRRLVELLEIQNNAHFKLERLKDSPDPAAIVLPMADQLDSLLESAVDEFHQYQLSINVYSRQEYVAAESAWVVSADDRGAPKPAIPAAVLKDMDSGQNYCLAELHFNMSQMQTEDPPKLVLSTASYGEIMRSCDPLIHELLIVAGIRLELLAAQAKTKKKKESTRFAWIDHHSMLDCMPLRKRVMEEAVAAGRSETVTIRGGREMKVSHLFLKPQSGRAAGIGVAFSTVYRYYDYQNEEKFELMFARRGTKVATYPSVFHVVPAGMCNTRDLDVSNDVFTLAAVSEAMEELFGQSDLDTLQGMKWADQVRSRAKSICISEKTGKSFDISVHLTGLAFDLFNLRPEVCGVIYIDSPDFYNDVLRPKIDEHPTKNPLLSEAKISDFKRTARSLLADDGVKVLPATGSQQQPQSQESDKPKEKDVVVQLNWEYRGHIVNQAERRVNAAEWVQSGLASAEMAARWVNTLKQATGNECKEILAKGKSWSNL